MVTLAHRGPAWTTAVVGSGAIARPARWPLSRQATRAQRRRRCAPRQTVPLRAGAGTVPTREDTTTRAPLLSRPRTDPQDTPPTMTATLAAPALFSHAPAGTPHLIPAPPRRGSHRTRRRRRARGHPTCFLDETGTVGAPGFAVGVLTVAPHSRLAGAITDLRTSRGFTGQWHASAATGASFGAYTALAAVLAADDSWTFQLYTPAASTPGAAGYVDALSGALAAAHPGGPVTVIADRYLTPAGFGFAPHLTEAAGRRGVRCTSITQLPSRTHDLLQVTDVLTYVTSDGAHRGLDRRAGAMKARLVGALERRLLGRLAA